jgi:amidase
MDKGVETKFHDAIEVLKRLGAVVEEVSIPMHEIAPAIFGAASKQGGAIVSHSSFL